MYLDDLSFEFLWKFHMSAAAYFVSFIDIVLLRFILIVSSPAVLELVFLSNLSIPPPIVSLVQLMTSFCSPTPQQKRVYGIFSNGCVHSLYEIGYI